MPFVTEELWQNLRQRLPADWQATESIMVAAYPEVDETAIDPDSERVMEAVIDIVHSIRNARAQYKVENTRWIEAQIYGGELTSAITGYSQAIQMLARVKPVTFLEGRHEGSPWEDTLTLVFKETDVVVPMESMVDMEAEQRRLQKEIEQTQAAVARLEARLKDKAFLTKAPSDVVEKEQQKLTERKAMLERLKQKIV
jgi:valyl-tRNA synthetase